MAAVSDPSELLRIEQAYREMRLPQDSAAFRIKREYRRLAKLWHPDTFAYDTPEQRRAAVRMRGINDAYQLIKHAPLRYRVANQAHVRKPSVEPASRHTSLVSDRVEYVVRFVCGVLFGFVVSAGALLSNMSLPIVAVIPFTTGTAAMVFGDRFWYWILQLPWELWP